MQKTLANLLQYIADKHDSGKLPTDSATLSFWTRLLNDGQRYCADRLELSKQVTLTTPATLPTDFLSVISVYGYQLVNASQSDELVGKYYWITGDVKDGYTITTPTADEINLTYVYSPTEMTTNTDVCIIPDPLAVACYAYAKLRQSETDPIGDAGSHLAECDTRLREVKHKQIANDGGYGFTIL
jgi:hypothetical protein